MSSPRKATGYLQSLHEALKNERYGEVPELSRKVRKHDPTRTCYARSAEVQALLIKVLRSKQRDIDNAILNDAHGRFTWLILSASQLSTEKGLLDESYAAHKTAVSEDKAYYDLTNFFYGLASGQIEAAAALKAQISTHPHNPCLSQAIALRGVLEELRGNQREALLEYQSYPYPGLNESSFESTIWLEHIRYRLAILSPSSGNAKAFETVNAHSKYKSSSRWIHVLSTQGDREAYARELMAQTQFPSADSTNAKLLDLVSGALDPWVRDGSDALQAEKHLDLLYEAGSKTFHSPRILRYSVHVLSALQRYDEALLALNAYLQIAVHALKTAPCTDMDSIGDIITTVHFAVVHILKRLTINDEPILKARDLSTRVDKIMQEVVLEDISISAMLLDIHANARLLDFYTSNNHTKLDEGVQLLSTQQAATTSIKALVSLAIAQIQQETPMAAMGSIRQALGHSVASIAAYLVFANLLCCEELYDRALAALNHLFATHVPEKNTYHFEDRVQYVVAKIMQLKIIEADKGAEATLLESSQLLVAYRTYLGDASNRIETNGGGSTIPNGQDGMTNGSPTNVAAAQPPSITVQPPASAGNEVPGFLAPSLPASETNNHSLTNGAGPRMAPNTAQEKIRSTSGPTRTSSLKVAPPSRHFGHHLHLRKSASVRSMRGQDSAENSSRSSSPLNHPPPSILSILPDIDAKHEEVELDRQLTAVELQDKKRKEVLAEIWLYIAHLCRVTKTRPSEVEQAIQEAIALVGTTPAIISMQLEVRLELARAQGTVTDDDLDVIEQGYDFALAMDDDDETTILSFAHFLLEAKSASKDEYALEVRRGRIVRAYELLDSLKSTPTAENPKLWFLSAEVALERGEEERAEEEYWQAVRKSDVAGVMDWYKLWKLV